MVGIGLGQIRLEKIKRYFNWVLTFFGLNLDDFWTFRLIGLILWLTSDTSCWNVDQQLQQINCIFHADFINLRGIQRKNTKKCWHCNYATSHYFDGLPFFYELSSIIFSDMQFLCQPVACLVGFRILNSFYFFSFTVKIDIDGCIECARNEWM